MINLQNLTPEEQKELARLTKKATEEKDVKSESEEYTPEEEEIIEFFMDLIPILQDAAVDLEKKGLLNRKDFLTKE